MRQELSEGDVLVIIHVQLHLVAQGNFTGDDFLAQRIFHASLNGAAQRAGAIVGVIALLRQQGYYVVSVAELHAALGKPLGHAAQHEARDAADVVRLQRVEHDQVVDAVDLPVIAAGGIGDGRGVAAAFMLGAEGVQVGTRFLVADECTVSEQYKEMVLKANDTSTRATGRSTGHPVRALKSPFTNAYAKSEGSGASAEELGAMGTGALRKAAKDGNYEEGSFLCGQIAGMVNERQSAREIVDDLVDGAEHVLKGACAWVA